MKKALSLFLILALCLSLGACGDSGNDGTVGETTAPVTEPPETTIPETTAYQYPYLVATEWKDIYDEEYTITLNQDGTGVRNGSAVTWDVMGDFLFITGVASGYTTEYDLVYKNDIWRIVTKDEERVLVGETGFETVFSNERLTATIHCHDGSTVNLTGKEVYNLYKANSGVFNELYKGADITFIGTIEEIDCEIYDSSYWVPCDYVTFKEGWYLKLLGDTYTDLLLTLSPGDKLMVTTQLVSVYNEDQISVHGAHENGSYSPETWATTVIEVVEDEE